MSECNNTLDPALERKSREGAAILKIENVDARRAAATQFGNELHGIPTKDFLSILNRMDQIDKCTPGELKPFKIE